jgi:hypothetical protein
MAGALYKIGLPLARSLTVTDRRTMKTQRLVPGAVIETFEFLPKLGKSSFLRKQESSLFKTFWIPACAGMTKWGYFSKVSV